MRLFPLFLLLTCMFLFPRQFYAQKYTIPWAQQQPAWVFPLWFEDGTGQKDTVYLSYDPNAEDWGIGTSDTIYGENYAPVDTSRFNVSWYTGSGPDNEVVALIRQDLNLGQTLAFYKGYLPLKISWDVSLFRSDTLPLPDQSPAPRAQGDLFHNGHSINPGPGLSSCPPVDQILISDTTYLGTTDARCVRTDSLILTDTFCTGCEVPWMQFYIRAWTGFPLGVGINFESSQSQFRVYPNPATSFLIVEPGDRTRYSYILYTVFGQELAAGNIIGTNRISIANLPPGMYYIVIRNRDNYSSRKFVIQH